MNSMHVLLIGNQGSFCDYLHRRLGKHFSVSCFSIDPSCCFDELLECLKVKLACHSYGAVVFVSGETRVPERMFDLNFRLPASILDFLSTSRIPFIYLSSLSVFGIPDSKFVSLDSPRNPLDLYGVTKNKFDIHVIQNFREYPIVAMMPGSIINPLSSHSILAKWRSFLLRSTLSRIVLRLVSPPGLFPCVSVEDLSSHIVEQVKMFESNNEACASSMPKFLICSKNIPLNTVVSRLTGFSSFFILPPFPPRLLSFAFICFPPNVRKKIVLSFSSVRYVGLESLLADDHLDSYLFPFRHV